MGKGRKRGMSLEELRGLDPEEVAAQCGGSQSADHGPNAGDAGEQEAIVADEEHTEDPAAGEVDLTEASVDVDQPDPEEPGASGDPQGDADGNAPNYRKAQMRASVLVQRLQAADPSMSNEQCLALLVELSQETAKPKRDIKPSQFVNAELEAKVEGWINLHPPELDVDADDASGNPPAADDAQVDQIEERPAQDTIPPNNLSLDELIERAKSELLPLAKQAREHMKMRRSDAVDEVAEQMANLLWEYSFAIYRAAGWDDDRITKQLTKPSEQSDSPWYQRVAYAMFLKGDKTPEQFLAQFKFPGIPEQSRKNRRSHALRQLPVPPIPEEQEDGSGIEAGDDQPAGEADAEPQPDVPEADVTETGPSPIDVNEVDGRRVVTSGEQPARETHVVKGGGVRMRPPLKPVDQVFDDAAFSDSEATDEQLIAELTLEVFEGFLEEVLADPDPEQAWMWRDSEDISREAQRRYLLARRTAQTV